LPAENRFPYIQLHQAMDWEGTLMQRRWKVMIVTSAAVFMALLDVTIVNIAFPDVRESFPDEPLANLSWVLNAYSVVFAAGLVPAGRLADRFGRRRMFLAGAVVFLIASVMCGLAGSAEILVAARVLQALGGATLMPTSFSLVLPEFPVEQRATATAVWTATGAVAAAVGPSLGGVLVDWQGWRAVFFVNLLIGLPALILARRLLRESKEENAIGWPDMVGAALLAVGVGALALGIVKGTDWGWTSGGVTWSFVVAAVLLAVFVVRSATHRAPVIDFSLFRIRSFAVSAAGSFAFGAGFFSLLLCNVLFLTGAWHYSVLHAGAALTPGPLAAAIMAPIAGRVADRFGPRAIALPGNALFALGPLLLALNVGAEPHYWSEFFPILLISGAGIGLSLPALGTGTVAELPRPRYATGIGIATCLRQIGAVVGVAALIAIIGTPGPDQIISVFHQAWLLIAACGVLTAVASTALGRVRVRLVESLPPGGRAAPAQLPAE
jgi:EmrB/QacA subfamily drug resistance transporter